MKIANCTLTLTKGHIIPKTSVTPAEVMYLMAEHGRRAGGKAIDEIKETGEVTRTDLEELQRLQNFYPREKVKAMFPGAMPRLPKDFAEALSGGEIATPPPAQPLIGPASTLPSTKK